MGDNLPELLYRAYCNGAGLAYGSDETPSWHNLRAEMRYAWEQAAATARSELGARFADEIAFARALCSEHDRILSTLDVMHARWTR